MTHSGYKWRSHNLCSFDSLEVCVSIVSLASFEALKRTQPRANCSVACYVSWRTRFADWKRVKNEIPGIPEEPQRSLPPLGVRRGYARDAFSSERIRYGPVPIWHPWSGHQDLRPLEISGLSTLYRSGDDFIVPSPGYPNYGGRERKNLSTIRIGIVGGIGKLFVKTTRQAQHTNRSTLEARRYHSSIHPKRLSE